MLALREVVEIPVEGVVELRLREVSQLVHRRDADRRRGHVKIPQFHATGNVVNVPVRHRPAHRGVEILCEIVKLGLLFRFAEDAGHGGRILQPAENEEIIPVGVHRLGRVSLMADGLGDQPVAGPLLRGSRLVDRGFPLGAKALDVAHRLHHQIPLGTQPGPVMRETENLHDQIDHLSVAVIFHGRIGAARIDHTGNLAARELELGIPVGIRLHLVLDAQLQQGGGGQRAVANPGPVVIARPRLNAGPDLVDEDVRQIRFDRVDDGLGGGGQPDVKAVEHRFPHLPGRRMGTAGVIRRAGPVHIRRGAPAPAVEGHRQVVFDRGCAREIEVVLQRAGAKSLGVLNPVAGWEPALLQVFGDLSVLKWRRPKTRRGVDRDNLPVVNRQHAVFKLHMIDARPPTGVQQSLPGRIYLKGTDRQEQFSADWPA